MFSKLINKSHKILFGLVALALVMASPSFAGLKYSTTLKNARLDAITTAAGANAKLSVYSGTQPAACGTATTQLVQLPMNATFAPAASGGVLTLNSITTTNASATGTATWMRVWKNDGTTCVMDGDVSTSGAALNLSSTAITSGQPVSVTSFVITAGN